MNKFEIQKAAIKINDFMDLLSNWYIRINRKRKDQNFYNILGFILLNYSKILAPFCPFIADEIYQKLNQNKSPMSVHLTDWPKFQKSKINDNLITAMRTAREIAKIALSIRAKNKLKVRQPISLIFSFQKTIYPFIIRSYVAFALKNETK